MVVYQVLTAQRIVVLHGLIHDAMDPANHL